MLEDIKEAGRRLELAVGEFNDRWPHQVVDGVVWELPLLTEQKTPREIAVTRLDGHEAIAKARDAFGSFQRDIGQAPGTVMRLPGVFFVSQSVLAEVEQINRLKQAVKEAIEQTRLEQNQSVRNRPKIMRSALGPYYSTKQLERSIQAFDGSPRLVIFTWAGHTGGGEYIPVGAVRKELLELAERRADRERISIKETLEQKDLDKLNKMADDDVLLLHKPVAPHPRAMFFFSESTRYDAMIHANLPAFVLANPSGCVIKELRDFDREARIAERKDIKERLGAIPEKHLFIPSKTPRKVTKRKLEVAATYGARE
ncbi:DNA replication terminus site-binding protein [Pseudomonas aeruginosa]|uniref:DNA replication terminus site-binding protein n=1 Tax=Pseudomonas aeruginosa TaxID=287 RepID=UPI0027393540|nr:DNA replication terminus site-binding protein [Pseudomonas aeruginosa]